jgi:hypothetical protein
VLTALKNKIVLALLLFSCPTMLHSQFGIIYLDFGNRPAEIESTLGIPELVEFNIQKNYPNMRFDKYSLKDKQYEYLYVNYKSFEELKNPLFEFLIELRNQKILYKEPTNPESFLSLLQDSQYVIQLHMIVNAHDHFEKISIDDFKLLIKNNIQDAITEFKRLTPSFRMHSYTYAFDKYKYGNKLIEYFKNSPNYLYLDQKCQYWGNGDFFCFEDKIKKTVVRLEFYEDNSDVFVVFEYDK